MLRFQNRTRYQCKILKLCYLELHKKECLKLLKYPFFSQYSTWSHLGPLSKGCIHLWEYNKDFFKFYTILQIIDTNHGHNDDGDLLFRPHMFVNDGIYGGLDQPKVPEQSMYLYLKDMETGEEIYNGITNYSTHDGTFSPDEPKLKKLSPNRNYKKLNEIDKVIFCYFYETSGTSTDYMAAELGKIFIGVYILKGIDSIYFDNNSLKQKIIAAKAIPNNNPRQLAQLAYFDDAAKVFKKFKESLNDDRIKDILKNRVKI